MGNFTTIYYNSSVKNAHNPCTVPGNYPPRVEQIVLGKKHGTYDFYGSEKCSPTKPEPVCEPKPGARPPFHCGPPKNGSCGLKCQLVTRLEHIDVRLSWYELAIRPMDVLHID